MSKTSGTSGLLSPSISGAKHFSRSHPELLPACSSSLWAECLSFTGGTSLSKTRELGPGPLPQHPPPPPTEIQREQDLVSCPNLLLSQNSTASPRFTALIASFPGLTKNPCGHHGRLGHNTEETRLPPRAKAAPGNQGGPSL